MIRSIQMKLHERIGLTPYIFRNSNDLFCGSFDGFSVTSYPGYPMDSNDLVFGGTLQLLSMAIKRKLLRPMSITTLVFELNTTSHPIMISMLLGTH